MVTINLDEREVDILWSALINQVCKEHIGMQDCKTSKELISHRERKDTCDCLIRKIKDFG